MDPFLGLTMKCWANGLLTDPNDRFELQKADCGTNICGVITGPTFGDTPMLTCAPKFKTGEKAETGGSVTGDKGDTLCKCDDADYCNKDLKCSACRIVSYWSFIALAVVIFNFNY